MVKHFKIYHVEEFAEEQSEPVGTKTKMWVRDTSDRLWLCKRVRNLPDGTSAGEDWAEVVAARLCNALTIPHAIYEFANWSGRAVVSRRFLWRDRDSLVLLDELFGLPHEQNVQERRKRSRIHHTLPKLWDLLGDEDLMLPPWRQVPKGISTAQEVFLGYLMLDALIGNTDRHEQNLGLIYRYGRKGSKRRRFLSPTFDHGSSMGRELMESQQKIFLAERDRFEKYRRGCKSKIFSGGESSKLLSTISAFETACGMSPKAATTWLSQLKSLDETTLSGIFAKVPDSRISESAKALAIKLVWENRNELLKIGAGLEK